MDLQSLSQLTLPGADGEDHRLGAFGPTGPSFSSSYPTSADCLVFLPYLG
jgi:hypothetical protein